MEQLPDTGKRIQKVPPLQQHTKLTPVRTTTNEANGKKKKKKEGPTMLVNEQHHQGFEEHDGYRISS
jgi:hypothetical protein